MATLGGYYLNPHKTQFDGSRYASQNCTPTSGANGANASTGGRINKSGGQIRALIPRSAETDPRTPGWSLVDLDRAMAKIGVPFDNRTGKGWSAILAALKNGNYVALQGDSDRFSNSTCSGAFNGNHCIGIHPATRVVNLRRQHWIDDPICKTGRWEYDSVIKSYGAKLYYSMRFGVFTNRVPRTSSSVTVTLKYGGTKLSPPQTRRISVPSGQYANIRSRPTTAASVVGTLANGRTFTAYQVTKTGQTLAGSSTWYGDSTGNRWLHITAF